MHHEPLLIIVAHLPTRTKPITLAYMNTTKVILKNVSIETELFLKVTDRTKGSGVYLIVLCTDTPDSQITFFNALKIKLPQVFFQPDVCHSTSLSLSMVATISEVESMLKDM